MAVKKMVLNGQEWRVIRLALRGYIEEVQQTEEGQECKEFAEKLYKKISAFSVHTSDNAPTEVTRTAFDWEV